MTGAQRHPASRVVCATCLTHPRLAGLTDGRLTIAAVRPDGDRCVMCGLPFIGPREPVNGGVHLTR